MKRIRDVELAWKYLNEWCEITSKYCNDGVVMLKEMERLKIKTRALIKEEE